MFHFFITRPLGFLINLIYELVNNYGLAIILFTIIVKMIILPLNVKSQKAMRKQQKIQPIVNELQKKYANDKEKLQREMMKIYKENDVSMMGGCLPMLIQLPILFGLYQVIQRPITYLAGASESAQETLDIISNLRESMLAKFPEMVGNLANMDVVQLAKTSQIQISTWCAKLGEQLDWVFNFDFLGLDLSQNPWESVKMIMAGNFSNMGVILLILIPIFAVLTTMLSTKITQMQSGANNNTDESAAQMSNTMTMMMPLMTGYFTFILPSGMGLYWIISNILQVVQQVALNNYFDKKGDNINVKLPENNRKKGKKR